MSVRRKLALLDVDPDLGVALSADRHEACRHELDVDVLWLAQGPWSAGGEHANPEHVGLLLLEGVIAREVVVSDTVSTELLGPGDVVRPWSFVEPASLLQLTVRWDALTACRVAVLDRRFGTRLCQWPEVNAALIDRINDRAQRLATTQAICQLNRVDRRVLSLFWHLAERWGRMTGDGVAVPLTLSHRMLGQLVGARRPTVSTAVSELSARGELVRRDDGTWLLTGEPVGVPTAEVERMVPIRRRLFAREPAEPAEPAAVVAGLSADAAVESAREEMRATSTRLRGESAVHLDVFKELAAEARRLQDESNERRRQLKREREERRARTAPRP